LRLKLIVEGLLKIVAIKASSNKGLSETHKKAFPNIIEVPRPQIRLFLLSTGLQG